jgi:ER lumen protein retaining receptor
MFRLAGDLCHVVSILVLLLRLRVSKNAVGISIKTQELYLLVFVTRYLDLFTTFYSLYNTIMKILYIAATAYIVYMVRRTEPFKTTYEKNHDSFLHWQYAVAPCVIIALISSIIQGFDIMEVSQNV